MPVLLFVLVERVEDVFVNDILDPDQASVRLAAIVDDALADSTLLVLRSAGAEVVRRNDPRTIYRSGDKIWSDRTGRERDTKDREKSGVPVE